MEERYNDLKEKKLPPLAKKNSNYKEFFERGNIIENILQIFEDGTFNDIWNRTGKKTTTFIIIDTNVFMNHLSLIQNIYRSLTNWRSRCLINKYFLFYITVINLKYFLILQFHQKFVMNWMD